MLAGVKKRKKKKKKGGGEGGSENDVFGIPAGNNTLQ